MSFNLKSKALEKKKKKEILVHRLDLLLQQNKKVKTLGKDSRHKLSRATIWAEFSSHASPQRMKKDTNR